VIEKMGRTLRRCASAGIPTLQFWNAQRCTMHLFMKYSALIQVYFAFMWQILLSLK